jgi:hypothetical protein
MGKHNHKAIFTAVVLHMVLGFVWYSPSLFLDKWQEGLGWTAELVRQPGPLPFIASIISAIFFCYLLSWIFQIAVIEEWKDGLATGLLVGVGFIAPAMIMHYMFMGVHADVILIDTAKEVIAAGMSGIILATWRADRTPEDVTNV